MSPLTARSLLLLVLLVAVAGPLAAQPTAARTDSLGLSVWTRSGASGPGFDGLPVRSVRDLAALLPGVRRSLSDGTLVYRSYLGTRRDYSVTDPADPFGVQARSVFDTERVGQEPTFVVDGVRVAERLSVPFEAVERVEVLTGLVPAQVGEAAGGVVLVETREGGEAYGGRVEGLTSERLDAFGYTVGAFSAGGPIGNARLGRFALSGEVRRLADATPFGADTYRLTDEAYADLLASPQIVRAANDQGDVLDIPFPWQAAQDAVGAGQPFTQEDLRALLDLPPGFDLAEQGPISAPETYTAERFERVRGKDDPLRAVTLDGNAVLTLAPSLRLRLGGAYDRERLDRTAAPAERFTNALYNRDHLYRAERDAGRFYTALHYAPSDRLAVRLQAEGQRWRSVQHPRGFSSDVEDALFYGDVESDQSAVARRYFVFRNGEYQPLYAQDGGSRPTDVGGTFALPGNPATIYRKGEGTSLRLHGSAALRLGIHRVEVGAEVERQTHRRFELAGASLARFYDDGNAEALGSEGGVSTYEALPFDALRPLTLVRYGYDFLGLGETDGEDVDGYFGHTDLDAAPYRPVYAAGYVQDRFALDRLTLDLGLRLDVFGSDATVLKDLFALVPIARAGGLPETPSGIDSDFAVYFNDVGDVVGFRDLDGRFYDAEGEESTADLITGARSGQTRRTEEPRSAAFESAPTHVRLQPRLGARFAVSERASVFAYYNRLARRPPPVLYAPFQAYEDVGIGEVFGNARLGPETIDDVGLGAEGRPVRGLSVRGTVFYRRHRELIQAAPAVGRTYRNTGSASVYGLDLTGALGRTHGVALRANYVLSFANGTGSDAAVTGSVVWRGDFVSTLTAPADSDVRHALDVVADYRVPEKAGPVLGGFGLGVVYSAQSGRPYTPLQAPGFGVGDPFTSGVAGINTSNRPWTKQFDLRLDKQFALGASTVTAFVWVENICEGIDVAVLGRIANACGRRNVTTLYRSTGEPDDDGFLSTPGGATYVSNAPDSDGRTFNYLAYVGGPVHIGGAQSTDGTFGYGPPRRVRSGLRIAL